jgi:hypothetical protein
LNSITELNLSELSFVAGGMNRKEKKQQRAVYRPNPNGQSDIAHISALKGLFGIAFSLAVLAGLIIYVRKQGSVNLIISIAYTATYIITGGVGYKLAAHLFKEQQASR